MPRPELILVRQQVQHPRQPRRVRRQEAEQQREDVDHADATHELHRAVGVGLDVGRAHQDVPRAIADGPEVARVVRRAQPGATLLQLLRRHRKVDAIVLVARGGAADHGEVAEGAELGVHADVVVRAVDVIPVDVLQRAQQRRLALLVRRRALRVAERRGNAAQRAGGGGEPGDEVGVALLGAGRGGARVVVQAAR